MASLRRHPASVPKKRHSGARFSSIEPLHRFVLGPAYRNNRGRGVGSVHGGAPPNKAAHGNKSRARGIPAEVDTSVHADGGGGGGGGGGCGGNAGPSRKT
ncbi:hypothetical protein CGRA01v4_03711 [Colletotrichum graminicola]|nr:hypothetical protein CGRA01v4_03711 [Colletotrichum graminicola]